MPRKTKEARREYSLANRERINANRRARYAKNPTAVLEYNREYRRKNAARFNALRRSRVYGTDGADIWAAQGGKCAICKSEMRRGNRHPRAGHLDHDHATGRVRGWLCSKCNVALGNFNDSSSLLAAAARYIKAHA